MFKNCPQAKVNINIECEHGLTSLAEHAAPRIAQRWPVVAINRVQYTRLEQKCLTESKLNGLKLTSIHIHDVSYMMVLKYARRMPLSELKTLDMQVQEAKRFVPSKLDRV